MPRRLRIHVPSGVYHVTLRGNHRQPIFHSDCDRNLLNVIVARALEKFETRLHAFCWMTNHVHMVLQAGPEPISRPMHDIAAEFARAMQLKLETTGHFFERRFHAVLVDTDSYLLELLRYVHRNPVTAGIAASVDAYRWTSHHNYRGVRHDNWVTTNLALDMFAPERARAIAAYCRFVEVEDAQPWEPLQALAPRVAVIGNEEFVARAMRSREPGKTRQSLEELLQEACRRFEVGRDSLTSPVRNAYVARVRAWIAYQAGERGIATLAAVARALGRTEGALRYAIRAYPNDIK
ncbi:MAG TPA: transposase [Steroidobacteraceae bacterium]|nr:transposase [Steroidobacteraceae bacterium]